MLVLKNFYRAMEQCFAGTGAARTPAKLAQRLAPAVLDHLGGALSVTATQLYAVREGSLALAGHWGPSRPDVARALAELSAPGERHREPPWTFASPAGPAGAIRVGDERGPVIVLFGIEPGGLGRPLPQADFSSALHSLQYAVLQHLQREALQGVMDQARAIQGSLLPPGRIAFDGYDAFAASMPAADVGGDLYDWAPLDAETLALTVADSSGHGLPAALQARDVAMGVRMGVERDLKVTRMVEKLNRIIHRSGLVTRFVSMFFGELEANGNLVYVNAGHPPAMLLDDAGVRDLGVGGPVLGPLPDAVYKLGFAHVDRGAALAIVTDGVIECADRSGAHFGEEGVRAWLAESRERSAEASIERLFERLHDHRGRGSFEDDVTALLVRRPRA